MVKQQSDETFNNKMTSILSSNLMSKLCLVTSKILILRDQVSLLLVPPATFYVTRVNEENWLVEKRGHDNYNKYLTILCLSVNLCITI